MDTLTRLASDLADDVMKAMEDTGNDRLYVEIGNVLAASSQSLEEAFLTEIRIRLSEQAARKALDRIVAQAIAAKKAAQQTG